MKRIKSFLEIIVQLIHYFFIEKIINKLKFKNKKQNQSDNELFEDTILIIREDNINSFSSSESNLSNSTHLNAEQTENDKKFDTSHEVQMQLSKSMNDTHSIEEAIKKSSEDKTEKPTFVSSQQFFEEYEKTIKKKSTFSFANLFTRKPKSFEKKQNQSPISKVNSEKHQKSPKSKKLMLIRIFLFCIFLGVILFFYLSHKIEKEREILLQQIEAKAKEDKRLQLLKEEQERAIQQAQFSSNGNQENTNGNNFIFSSAQENEIKGRYQQAALIYRELLEKNQFHIEDIQKIQNIKNPININNTNKQENLLNHFDKEKWEFNLEIFIRWMYIQIQKGNILALKEYIQQLEYMQQHADVLSEPLQLHLYRTLAALHLASGSFNKALLFQKKMLDLSHTVFSNEHWIEKEAQINLASIYTELGNYIEAEKVLNNISVILNPNEKSEVKNYPSLTLLKNFKLAEVYRLTGKRNQAMDLYNQSISSVFNDFDQQNNVDSNSFRFLNSESLKEYQQHPIIAEIKNSMAILKIEQIKNNDSKEMNEIKKLFQDAESIWIQIYGEKNVKLGYLYNNLGVYYNNVSAYIKNGYPNLNLANQNFQLSLETWKANLPEDHPNFADYYNNNAELKRQLGDYFNAEQWHEKALNLRESVLEKNHPLIATSLNNLGEIYSQQKRFNKAEPLLKRALIIRQDKLSENHPDLAVSLNNNGNILFQQQEYKEAKKMFEQALSIQENYFGQDSPHVSYTLNNLALALAAQRDYATAEFLLNRAILIDGSLPAVLAADYMNKGDILLAQEKYAEAEIDFNKSLKIWKSITHQPTQVKPVIDRLSDLQKKIKKR